VDEIKTVPYVPLSHPFVERLIGTIRRECLERLLFWTAADLELKLVEFQRYHNGHRAHAGLEGRTPEPSTEAGGARATVRSYRWQSHCRGLHQTHRGLTHLGDVGCQATRTVATGRPCVPSLSKPAWKARHRFGPSRMIAIRVRSNVVGKRL